MTEKRYSHDAIVIVDHLKKDLIYIDGDDDLLELAEYVDRLQEENEQLKKKNQELENELSFNKLNNERIKSINYQLSAKCHDYEKSLYNGRKYLKKLNKKFEKIFGISLENFLDIEYKK